MYKFKSLNNFPHVLDIFENKEIYCALYSELNDPFESLYINLFRFPAHFPVVFLDPEKFRICSFSENYDDVRMWSFYADSHKGIAIEIEIEDNSKLLSVDYDDSFIRLIAKEVANRDIKVVLKYKTTHWSFEKEFRIINDSPFYPIPGKI